MKPGTVKSCVMCKVYWVWMRVGGGGWVQLSIIFAVKQHALAYEQCSLLLLATIAGTIHRMPGAYCKSSCIVQFKLSHSSNVSGLNRNGRASQSMDS